jgi:hypothetical protein
MSIYQAMRGLLNVPWYFRLSDSEVVDFLNTTTTATASATIHTKGAWTELIASTSGEAGLLYLWISNVATTSTETAMLLDVATGASGSESVIAENIAVGGAATITATVPGIFIPLPVRIAAGSRISVRIQALIASDTCVVRWGLLKFAGQQMLSTTVDVIGTSTATSRGTQLSGASGSWVEIGASSAKRYRALYIVPSNAGTAMATITISYDIGSGASGSEVTLGKTRVGSLSTEDAYTFSAFPNLPIACDVAAGSRLAVKHNIASNPSNYAVCLIGVP